MTVERKPSFIDFKAKLEAKTPTPRQIKNVVDAFSSEDFEKLEPYHQPTKFDIEQKQEVIKRTKHIKS